MPYQPHPERLKKSSEFERVYQEENKHWNAHFVVYVYCTDHSQTRLGITASKKVGKSVQRNRVKRLIREAFRALKVELHTGYDIVVVGRKAAINLSGQQAKDSLRQLFYRASLLTNT